LRDENGELAGVVHRDVSPQNVLVGGDGVSRITDFGVARAASRLSATRVGQLKGKIAYMAPEQARGEIDLDRRADVFAAGVVFWEALAHRRLFKAQNEAGTLARVLQEPIPDLHLAAPHLSPVVCRVVMRALERDRERRIGTCAEFADALERAAQSTGEIGSPRDLKRYMDAVIGHDIRAQREAVRAWTARADSLAPPPSQFTPTGGATNTGLETVQRQERTQAGSGRGKSLGVSLAMLFFGAGVYVAYDQLTADEVAPPLPAAAESPSSLNTEPGKNEVEGIEKPESSQKKSAPDALTLSEVVEDEAKAKAKAEEKSEIVAPAPRPAASRDRSKAIAAPASKSRPRTKKSAVDDDLESNPYR
jgi:serine/threonine-protein kinase